MAFIAKGWTLHKREITLKDGRKKTLYFFSKKIPKYGGRPCNIPEGYTYQINKRLGLPYLVKQY
jgi:hypothetical protein